MNFAVVLPDATAAYQPVTSEILEAFGKVEVLLLNGRDSYHLASSAPERIKFVMWWRDDLADRAACTFERSFVEMLAAGWRKGQQLHTVVHAAFANAKGAMRADATSGTGTPHLHCCCHSKSTFVMPWTENPHFTGRTADLFALYDQLRSDGSSGRQLLTHKAVVQAHGGVGKTQLAVRYCFMFRGEYPGGVFCLLADTTQSLYGSVRKVCTALQLPCAGDSDDSTVVAGFKQHLQQRSDWLLLVDNADDKEVLLELPSCLPSRGHIIVTSRVPCGDDLGASTMHIGTAGIEQAMVFMVRRARGVSEHEAVLVVTKLEQEQPEEFEALQWLAGDGDADEPGLGGLFVAMEQAGAYMLKTGGCTFAKYIRKYRKGGLKLLQRQKISEISLPNDQLARNERAERTVVNTFALNIESFGQYTKRLLQIISYLAPEQIAEQLLLDISADLAMTAQLKQEGSSDEDDAEDRLEDATNELRGYSMLERSSSASAEDVGNEYTIHRMVQAVCRKVLPLDPESLELLVKYLNRKLQEYIGADSSSWQVGAVLLSHAVVVCTHCKRQKDTPASTKMLMESVARAANKNCNYRTALKYWQQVLEVAQTAGK